MYHIFLSHKKEDEKAACAIASLLRTNYGLKVYIDVFDDDLEKRTILLKEYQILPDKDKWEYSLTKHLIDKLKQSAILLVLMTPACLNSKWVPFECGVASAMRKKVLVYLDGVENDESFEFISFWPPIKSLKEIERYISDIESEYQKLLVTGEIIKLSETDEYTSVEKNFIESLSRRLDHRKWI